MKQDYNDLKLNMLFKISVKNEHSVFKFCLIEHLIFEPWNRERERKKEKFYIHI